MSLECSATGRLSRRGLLLGAGAASITPRLRHALAAEPAVDHTIRIGPISLELAPGKTIKTTGYNGSVPGPVLRLHEGRPVKIKVINDAGYQDLVHWHGLYLPALQDGATEEGSPIIPVGESLIYSFTPRPTGTRWYHTHAMAMTDLTRSTYSGAFASSRLKLRSRSRVASASGSSSFNSTSRESAMFYTCGDEVLG